VTQPRKETRRHRRFTVDVAATVHASDGSRLAARTRDLSRSGICLITASPLKGGESLTIELVLAFGDNAFSEPLRLVSHVVWCTPISQAFQVGAMFDGLDDEQDGFLEMFLHFLDGTLAPKGVEAQGDDGPDGQGEQDDEEPLPPDVKDDPFR
jgi:hypothetical protein